jgi:hypothetical protein
MRNKRFVSLVVKFLWRGGLLFFLGITMLPCALFAADATLFLSPITGMYTTGEAVTIRVMVGTGGESTNAIEGVLRYDPKEVEVIGIDRSASILSSWTREPLFDNEKGEVVFAGAMSGTSSYSGARGEIIALSIKGLRSEETRMSFDSGSASAVRAADGTGGNLLSTLSSGVYVFAPKETNIDNVPALTPAASPSPSGEVLGVATGTNALSSPTHPNQDTWYALASTTVQWDMPMGVTRVRLALNRDPAGEGLIAYSAPRSEKVIEDIPDGIWFVHLSREWEDGNVDHHHFRLQIDTDAPRDLVISERPRPDTKDPSPIIMVSATDTRSGVDHYEFVIDEAAPLLWSDDGSHEYRLPAATPGPHTLHVAAVDKAGNRSVAQLEFTVLELDAPALVLPPDISFREGDPIRVEVSGLPGALVRVGISRDGGTPVIEEFTLNETGKGEFVSAFIPTIGTYTITGTQSLASGATSLTGEALTVVISSSLLGVLKRNPMIPFAILGLILLFSASWYFWRRFFADSGDEEFVVTDDYVAESVDATPVETQRMKRPVVSSGVVVLGKAPHHSEGQRSRSTLSIKREG